MDREGKLIELGNPPESYSRIEGQYIGLIRVRASFVTRFARKAKALVRDNPRAFMTSLLQRLVDAGLHVQTATTQHGWLEIDRPSDLTVRYQRYCSSHGNEVPAET